MFVNEILAKYGTGNRFPTPMGTSRQGTSSAQNKSYLVQTDKLYEQNNYYLGVSTTFVSCEYIYWMSWNYPYILYAKYINEQLTASYFVRALPVGDNMV